MSERGRFVLIAGLLVAAVLISAAVAAQRVRMEVLSGAQLALSAAGIPFYGVDVDGRDVVLRGFVPSSELADRMVATVAAVPGVRSVRDETVVERISSRQRAVAPGAAPELRVQRLGSRVRVSGRLPSAAAATAWVDALSARVGSGRVESALREDPGVQPLDWLGETEALAALVADLQTGCVLTVRGNAASLSGPVRDAEQRDRIVETARAVPSLTWRFDLFALDGSVGGGAP
jgi:hypothetical protein